MSEVKLTAGQRSKLRGPGLLIGTDVTYRRSVTLVKDYPEWFETKTLSSAIWLKLTPAGRLALEKEGGE